MKIEHTDSIEFPNGLGFTPCSVEYRTLTDEKEAMISENFNLDDLTPANYQRFCELDNQLMTMQMNGHVGTSVRY